MTWHRHSRNIIGTERWKRVRREVMKRDGFKCVLCGAAGRLECDHIKPVRKGGAEYDMDNLQMLCKECHARKTRAEIFGDKPPDPQKIKWAKLLRGGI